MGYDLTMTKVKKKDLEALKELFPECSLSDFWSDQMITYYTESEFEKEYGKEALLDFKNHNAIFCKELVYTNRRVFQECSLIPNDENDFITELSIEEVKELFSWLDNFMRNDFLDNIEKYYGIAYDTVYYELHLLLKDIKEDEVVLFHHNW